MKYYHCVFFGLWLKVSKFRKQIMVQKLLPKIHKCRKKIQWPCLWPRLEKIRLCLWLSLEKILSEVPWYCSVPNQECTPKFQGQDGKILSQISKQIGLPKMRQILKERVKIRGIGETFEFLSIYLRFQSHSQQVSSDFEFESRSRAQLGAIRHMAYFPYYFP